ncbi:MAG: hypothetical protein GYB66_08665 [Chloroflexi bacterium]|nr:hypothetical protein [Chloroflexota bacterium]
MYGKRSAQVTGGIFFCITELVDPDTEVFGYALVAPDVTCSSEEHVDFTADCFPITGNEGGWALGASTLAQ